MVELDDINEAGIGEISIWDNKIRFKIEEISDEFFSLISFLKSIVEKFEISLSLYNPESSDEEYANFSILKNSKDIESIILKELNKNSTIYSIIIDIKKI